METTCQTTHLLHHHPQAHRSYDDMSFRASFSRFRKKIKHGLLKSRDGSERRGIDSDGERSDQSVRVGATTSKGKSSWKSTASSTAKLLLRTVEKSSDAFPPLKSVAGGLCAILDNCEV